MYCILMLLFFMYSHAENQTHPEDESIMHKIPGNCSLGQFDCGEKCIPIRRFRDCHTDCADGSDEACWPGFVRCLPTDSGCACIRDADANRLCPEKKENKFCSLPQKEIFHCKNGNCILNSWVNDRKNDCGDWTDEQLTALQPVRN